MLVSRDGIADVSGGGIWQQVFAPHAVPLQQQQMPRAYSRGAVHPQQQRQSRRSVYDPAGSRREAVSVIPSSSLDQSVCYLPDSVSIRGPEGQYRTVFRDKAGEVESVVSGRYSGSSTRACEDVMRPLLPVLTGAGVAGHGVGGIYDCGTNANYRQPKTHRPPNAPKDWVCVCSRCGRTGHVAAHCVAKKRFEGDCDVCGQRGHTSRHCRLRNVSGAAVRAGRSQQQLPLADATRTTAIGELDLMESRCATCVALPDPELVSSSEREPLLDTSWQDEPAQQDDESVLGAKSVIYEVSSWNREKEQVHSSSSSSKNGSSDGASSSERSDATWSGPPTHQFHPEKCHPGRAWRRGAILGVEHPFDRGKSLAFAAWR